MADVKQVGELINLSERLADRSRPSAGPPAFFFSLDCPLSYLAAERVERALGEVRWVPVLSPLSESSGEADPALRAELAAERLAVAEREARMLSLPLVEPQRFPMDARRASRAAIWASAHGRGATFALAVARLGFCGGFDIGSDTVIAEAAAVAGLNHEHALDAARDYRHDLELEATAAGLATRGIAETPAVRIDSHWFQGPSAVIAAVSFNARRRIDSTPLLPFS